MPHEKGGRADKNGNKYEIRWTIYQTLKVIEEELLSVELEPIGEEEKGIDIWITFPNGSREGQQCKSRDGSEETWNISSLKSKKIISKWKNQLDSCGTNKVTLVSPLSCIMLVDLIIRAKNTNNNPQDFLKYQVENSSKDFISFFRGYCNELNINWEDDSDLYKVIDYLLRTSYKQIDDSYLKEAVLDKIQYLFVGDKNVIYNCLENLIVEGDILGKPMTNSFLRGYLRDNYIQFRDIALDTKVASRIEELNEEYKSMFEPIGGNLLQRNESKLCIDNITAGNSIIISGAAGSGKSGCTHAIITYCEKNNISYLALKLDKRIPHGSAEKWGVDLGLPASIPHSIHSISKNDNAVIILDQLDALRWTYIHSRDALIICSEIIRQVENLNLERYKKISVIIVCRTYDLENDNNIKSLFNKKNENENTTGWINVKVKELDEDTVKNIVGERYNQLSIKLKNILRIPSNLFIWEHLDKNNVYDEFSTANELIYEWWAQLLYKCEENEVNEKTTREAKESIIGLMEKCGNQFVPLKLLNVSQRSLSYLISSGIITLFNNCVSFTHQSILDYFLVEKMLQRYFDKESIISIIGTKEKQTPGKRYQIQMLLQNIEEYDQSNFIDVGKQMLESSNVRFFVKYVFLEVLGQCTSVNSDIEKFLIEYCENEKLKNHILEIVISGHPVFVEILLDNGILDKWMQDERKNIAINLMVSICPQYSSSDVTFIKKYAFISKEDDNKFVRCFSLMINEDTDELFNLRMDFYRRYPEMSNNYINWKEAFKSCELRCITILAFFLEYKIKNKGRNIFNYEEELIDENSEVLIKNGENVIDELLPFIPLESDYYKIYSDWDGKYTYNNGLERACIEIIKKANAAIISKNPDNFIDKYSEFIGKDYLIFNEIILSAFEKFPINYSNKIIRYIINNFNNIIFDRTSGNEDELALVKEVLKKHTIYCDKKNFSTIEEKIIFYIDPRAKEWYKNRIEYNKNNPNVERAYWSFWGDLQFALLPCLPIDRMSIHAKELNRVLIRRLNKSQNLYVHYHGHSGSVSSPIANKKIGDAQWMQILTNIKLKERNRSNWIEVKGGFIESSIDTFSRSFNEAVSAEPERFISILLRCDKEIDETYIDSFFSGIASSKQLNEISVDLLEKIILKYRYDYDSYRASYICRIIGSSDNWSQQMFDILNDIAINHNNPNNDNPNITSDKDKDMKTFDMLQSNAINCVRGNAVEAIGNILWKNIELYKQYKETVSNLINDTNPAVRYANLSALTPIFNIDRDWATEKILYTFERDYRMAGFYSAKQLFFLMYPNFRERVLKIILNCYFSDDKDLVKVGAYSVSEMYIRNSEFQKEILDIDNMDEEQAKYILEMAILYFNTEENNTLVKNLIKRYKDSKFNLEYPLSRIFYDNLIDLNRDRDFLIELMNSNMSRRIVYVFVHYLEENSKSVLEYKDIILSMSYSLIKNKEEHPLYYDGVDDELSKLIVGLYDETSQRQDETSKLISQQCMDIWDLMFEKQIGIARVLSRQMLDK